MFGYKIITGFYDKCLPEDIRATFLRIVAASVLLYAVVFPVTVHASSFCGPYDSINVLGGEYRINSNVWGSTPGEQCIEASSNSTYFSVTHSTHNSSGVAAYPFIFKGCHWGNCTQDSGMPLKVSEIASAPFGWSIDTNSAGGTWNAAYESWFSTTGGTAPNAAELMIWINYAGGAGPAGSKVATVTIGGADWDVYFADWSHTAGWYYIAYKITSPATSVNLDLKDFIDDSVSRGFIDTDWYLDNMEAGFEIWRDGEGLTSNSFYASPINNFPSVSITSPSNSDTFTEGADITIDANASDSDGNVSKVEFYQGSTKLGEDTVPPYSYTWQSIPAGDFNLTAVASDNHGAETTSEVVHIKVIGGGGSGRILREWWTNMPGDAVSDLTSHVNYPDNPAGRGVLASLEGPTDTNDNYGDRIRGFLHPITTGDYTFRIASDANSELWLSADADPCNAVLIAYVPGRTEPNEWDKFAQQQSLPISLTGGGKYYIEILHKAGDGSDNLSVAWEGPNLSQQIIHGLFLSPYLLNFNGTIQKCAVKAGKIQGFDSISCSGTFGATNTMLDAADNITVQIYSGVDDYTVYNQTIAMESFSHSRNIYSYKHKVSSGRPGAITSLKFDTGRNTFSMQTKNTDLTGLGCPLYLLIDFGTYAAMGVADENAVNGKNLIPACLMRTHKDTLVVNKAKASSSSLSVTGNIAMIDTDVNLSSMDVNFIWGAQMFRVPPRSFNKTGHLFKCSKVVADTNGDPGLVTAQVDIYKATFTLSVTGANAINAASASIPFGISFADFNEIVVVNRVTGRSW
jgi:hypothetical protein